MSVMRFVWALVLGLVFSQHIAANDPTYRVGVAKVDITPRVPIWLAGYADRRKPSEGIDQPLFLKALAVQEDKGVPLILITADLIGFPRTVTDEIANRLHTQFGVPRDNFLMIASHTHTGPVIYS